MYRRHSGDNGYCFLHIHLNLIRKIRKKKRKKEKQNEVKKGMLFWEEAKEKAQNASSGATRYDDNDCRLW